MKESSLSHPPPRIVLGLVAAAAVLAVAGVRFARGTGGPSEIDETYWIGSAYYFDLAVFQARPMHPDWGLLPARENPPAGKYLIGAALALGGHRVTTPDRLALFLLHFADRPGAWGRGESIAKRRAVVDRLSPGTKEAIGRPGFAPVSSSELRLGRGLMAAMGVLATAGVIALGWIIAGPAAGTLAGLLFALHPITLMTATRVSVDMTALVFSIAAMIALVLLLRPDAGRGLGRTRRIAALAAWLGVALALACGSKMNAAVVPMTTIAAWAGLLFARDVRWRRPMRAIAGALALSAVLFVAINPALYPDPIGGVLALFRENRICIEIQFDFLDGALRTLPERIRALDRLVFRRPWVGALFAAIVIVQTARAAWEGRTGRIAVCLWWWLALLAVGVWIPFAWPRYALPLLPPTAILAADAIVGLPRAIAVRIGRPSAP